MLFYHAMVGIKHKSEDRKKSCFILITQLRKQEFLLFPEMSKWCIRIINLE